MDAPRGWSSAPRDGPFRLVGGASSPPRSLGGHSMTRQYGWVGWVGQQLASAGSIASGGTIAAPPSGRGLWEGSLTAGLVGGRSDWSDSGVIARARHPLVRTGPPRLPPSWPFDS